MFCNLIEFPTTKLFKIQYLLHFKKNLIQITLIKSYSSKAFQKHQECAQIPLWILILI